MQRIPRGCSVGQQYHRIPGKSRPSSSSAVMKLAALRVVVNEENKCNSYYHRPLHIKNILVLACAFSSTQ